MDFNKCDSGPFYTQLERQKLLEKENLALFFLQREGDTKAHLAAELG